MTIKNKNKQKTAKIYISGLTIMLTQKEKNALMTLKPIYLCQKTWIGEVLFSC